MNIQNIIGLSKQLEGLGFTDLAYTLAKRICFKPKSFVLSYQVEKNGHNLIFQLSFAAVGKSDEYAFMFYDAALQKAGPLQQIIAGVDVAKLSQRMAEVDWKKAFDFSERTSVALTDRAAFDKELKIESIAGDLAILETTQEGKPAAMLLKSQHWTGSAYHDVYGSVGVAKTKAEVSQRFYFVEGQSGISVEEAFRFLQNRLLEKDIHSQRKRNDEQGEDDGSDKKGSGLLRKKRTQRTRNSKS